MFYILLLLFIKKSLKSYSESETVFLDTCFLDFFLSVSLSSLSIKSLILEKSSALIATSDSEPDDSSLLSS